MNHTTVNQFYKSLFNAKTYKLSLESGCTCPTRDGTLDTRGCIFCSAAGSGDFTRNSVEEAKTLVASKIKDPSNAKYIVYFQNFTNTYGDLKTLSAKWSTALSSPNVVGLALGTRPDCLSPQCLKLLGSLTEKYFIQIELGLQTTNEATATYIRRHFPNQAYFDAVKKLHQANPKIHVVTHIIFGLPGDTHQDMLDTVQAAVNAGTDGIKITSLYILHKTDLETDFRNNKVQPLKEDEYFSLLEAALKIIPPEVIIHRLTGDPPKSLLIEPKWTMNKKSMVNRINKLLDD